MGDLLTEEELEALDISWGQLRQVLDSYDRQRIIPYAKQHIAYIYGTIRKLQRDSIDISKLVDKTVEDHGYIEKPDAFDEEDEHHS